MVDQKVAVVTGATSGIGRWIALGIARAGYQTILVVRDEARGEATQAWISSQAPGAATELVMADLASLAQVRDAGSAIVARRPRIDLLVNNAGMITPSRQVTVDGHEMILAVNHLAPFVLTGLLRPALMANTASRVVNVGSTASDRAGMDVDNLELVGNWNALRAYGRSKLAIMMASFEWARRMPGVDVNVVHPGVVATPLFSVPGPIGLGWALLRPFLIGEQQGADTPLHVALSPDLTGTTGIYFKRRCPAQPNRLALDRALTARLWTTTTRLAGG